MTRHAPVSQAAPAGDAPRQLAQLREVLVLVEQIARRPQRGGSRDSALDEAARVGAAYGEALPILQRRFDALVAEAAAWAAAGVEALSRAGAPAAAARRLAAEIEDALADLLRLLKL